MTRAINESSRQFLKGAASYFGLPLDQLMAGTVGDNGDAMEITLTLSLTLADLSGIVKRAEELEQQRAGQALDAFLSMGAAAQAMKNIGDSVDSLGKAFKRAGVSKEQSDEFDAEGLTGTWRDPSTEGVGGRKVVHVDTPEEQGDAGLPASLWVKGYELAHGQSILASATRGEGLGVEYLMQVCMLTDEQRVRHGVAS